MDVAGSPDFVSRPVVNPLSHSLNSLKGGYIGTTIGVTKGDTRSLDSGSCELLVSRLITPVVVPYISPI